MEHPSKLKATPKLINTITWKKLGQRLRSSYQDTPLDVKAKNIKYRSLGPFPAQFDPRDPSKIPKSELSNWFFMAEHDHLEPIISFPLDQAKCGSCWAFATASMFTDTLRHMILTIFGNKSCFYSKLFTILSTCTGEIGVEEAVRGVVNSETDKPCTSDDDCDSGICLDNKKCQNLISVEIRDRISAYYVVGFAPKPKDTCTGDTLSDCTTDCTLMWRDWRQAIKKGHKLEHISSELKAVQSLCSGCEGNAIIMPLYMFASSGATLLSEFPIQDWGCIFGTNDMRKVFCTEEFSNEELSKPLPTLIKCDRYGHFTSDDLARGNKPAGINTMEQWIRTEIFNNSSVSIGYTVYPSFFSFFSNKPKGVYTHEDFIADIKQGEQVAAGGHAVDIIGWGEQEINGVNVPYWVVRNSWGEHWGDQGFFRIERSFDQKLKSKGYGKYIIDFEDEFGTVYYAPFPDMEMYNDDYYQELDLGTKTVKVSKNIIPVIKIPPFNTCKTRETKKVTKQLISCRCPPGYIKNTSGVCAKDTATYGKGSGMLSESNTGRSVQGNKSVSENFLTVSRDWGWFKTIGYILLLALIFISLVFVFQRLIRRKFRARV